MQPNIVIDISLPILYLAKSWLSSYGPKCCRPIKLQDSLKCKKEVDDEVYFWHADKDRSFLQVDTIILGVRSQACSKYSK